ncbi:MAG: hypothetical protein H8E72_00780 [Candidatus Marinimicrobia bacterium]|nr:hypothetical protein [Candidatus Neomarinimicrobiota bacterium]
MFENLKDSVVFDFKENYDMTDKIEEELVQIEENSHNYATEKFVEILDKAKGQKEPVNISSIGENLFYHGIHFLKGRGWTEESILEAVRNHFHMYDPKIEEVEPEPDADKNDKK